ncbi:MAG TPA: hypothetical protein ACFCUD_00275 [Cyclobacteriaceae bacterium]
MNYLRKLRFILLSILITVIVSCEDEDAQRIPFDEIEKVVNMRILIDPEFSFFDGNDIPNGKLVMDMFTENQNIDRVDLLASYTQFSTGEVFSSRVAASIDGEQFNQNNGILDDFEVTAQEMATAFGVSIDEIGPADRFDFNTLVTLDDGRVFPDTILQGLPQETVNVTPNILNSAPTSSFTTSFTAFVACNTPATFATGTYILEQVDGPGDPFFGGPSRWPGGGATTQEVTLTATSPIGRTFQATWITFTGAFNFSLVCGDLLWPVNPAPAACNSVAFVQSGSNSYDESDDSEFLITITDNIDTDCSLGTPDQTYTLRLTKK